MPSDASLFDPIALGAFKLPNRLVMAPLTRTRSRADGRPGPKAELYYSQRSSAGMIISEGTCISPQGVGNPGVPGLWTDEQVEAWKPISDAVHTGGAVFVAQLWHTGRASHPTVQPNGETPVGPSAIAVSGLGYARDGWVPFVTPRELEISEIPAIVADYGRAAENAIRAGFDGVELHSANGYLIDQFLQDNANHRTDEYGGSIPNRARLLLEVVEELINRVGADRVGVRLSPSSPFQDMADSNPQELFNYVLRALEPLGLAYVHLIEPGISGYQSSNRPAEAINSEWVRQRYSGALIVAGGYNKESATNVLAAGNADAVAFGRDFIANPDLPRRLAEDAPLNEADPETFYGRTDEGYIDYPELAG
ncbi:N-ethylmaleimide reductase [Arthrobacter sp. 1088]|uniref:alkene reductase n=1 Tax=Arthrobacter sp. 1088 TaxID=2817768 RepID=UPI00285ED4FA|nr:alkene reductase [Arthrobacter sp. 1088]MDR6688680.1 N-ethylmaleimide reductase [Arthrobacter sp. 1088]